MIDSKDITKIVSANLHIRHRKEVRFKWLGRLAVGFGFFLVFVLIADITYKALPAFHQHWVAVDISYKSEWLSTKDTDLASLKKANYRKVFKKSLYQMFPEVKGRSDKRKLTQMISSNAEFTLRDYLMASPNIS